MLVTPSLERLRQENQEFVHMARPYFKKERRIKRKEPYIHIYSHVAHSLIHPHMHSCGSFIHSQVHSCDSFIHSHETHSFTHAHASIQQAFGTSNMDRALGKTLIHTIHGSSRSVFDFACSKYLLSLSIYVCLSVYLSSIYVTPISFKPDFY